MNKQYNEELQARVEKYLKDENLSQAKAAPILGISQAVLSQYRRSCYEKGDITAVENSWRSSSESRMKRKRMTERQNHSKQKLLLDIFQLPYQKQRISQFVTVSLKKELLLLMEMLELERRKQQPSSCRTIRTQQFM